MFYLYDKMESFIHHIEWCVKDVNESTNNLITQYGFELIAERHLFANRSINDGNDKISIQQKVVQSGSSVFLLTQNDSDDSFDEYKQSDTSYPILSCCSSKRNHRRDTVFNVCLEVKNIDACIERIIKTQSNYERDNSVLIPPITIECENNSRLRYSVIQSICGNIIHTLIESKEYRQHRNLPFLPGFHHVQNRNLITEKFNRFNIGNKPLTSYIDHVTYVCCEGQSKSILRWYKDCFGMERFLIDSRETVEDDGIEIGQEVGMRLTVGEWISSWMCREEGVRFDSSQCSNEKMNFKLVLAEPLPGHTFSHVQQFLDDHGGPGIQHIGLMADTDITSSVERMVQHGAKFRKPPPAYYKLTDKRREILQAKECLSKFEKLGLLLDTEVDSIHGDNQITINECKKILIQIFSKPLFDENTFFLEILERRGARGFGAGNITALAKSIILQQENERLHTSNNA